MASISTIFDYWNLGDCIGEFDRSVLKFEAYTINGSDSYYSRPPVNKTVVQIRNEKSRRHLGDLLAFDLKNDQKRSEMAGLLPRQKYIRQQFRRFSANASFR